ncbi:hypothetical protein [Bradyrhizobium sp. BRP23]|uniref:hypothetical protein n=1 Tax=Bradyrhizobium sp. BRP23 TaxID=2793820 RepID=UPI001CD68637|nr:hypothetical protein [Bradyrhizobium sp. BRP23]MCA1381298.1 hypothetical protein [Bradyrhizobium sp. BRP05]MCA1418582.1 hypothetical protein [Bradyrhizobium sp. BRP23]
MMADHVRKQIRDAVVARLTGLPSTGNRVYVGRTRPLGAAHKPTLLIYTRSETASRTVKGVPPKLDRVMILDVEGRVSLADVPDDTLDQIAGEIEAAMWDLFDGRGTFINGLAMDIKPVSTELIAEAAGERHIGGVRVEYLVTYRTAEGAPTAAV